jgi:hypothetical protein
MISISTLPDVKVFLEPFAVPYYRGHPVIKTHLDFSFEEATQMVLADYPGKAAVFVKDFAFSIAGKYEAFKDKNYVHSFLIRNPKRVIMSYYKLMGDNLDNFKETRSRGEIGIFQLRDFYFFLKEHLNIDPVIIDADDLLANPEGMMELYCNKVGLTYKRGMTKWDSGSAWGPNWKDDIFFSDLRWVDAAVESSGFKEPTPLPTVPDDLPTDFIECLEECLKPYNELYRLRMTVEPKCFY